MHSRNTSAALIIIVTAASLFGCGSMYYETQTRTISRRHAPHPLTGENGLPADSSDQTIPPDTSNREGDPNANTVPGSPVDPLTSDEPNSPATPAGETDDSTCYGVDQFICEIELAIIRRTNVYRGGMKPFRHNKQVSFAARQWSAEQAVQDQLSHAGFPTARYDLYTQEFTDMGSVKFWAENVAYAFSESTRADDIALMFVNLWWESPPHRENIVGDYEIIGVGVIKADPYYWATQIFGSD